MTLSPELHDWVVMVGFLVTCVLFGLSLTAYLSTRGQKMLLITTAFLLWSARLGLEVLSEFAFSSWEHETWLETTLRLFDLFVPLLIFFAVIKPDRVR